MTVFFVTLGGSLTFFSHLMVPSSHCAVPTSHMTVLFSHLIVPYFFLIFDGSILTLYSSNIRCDSFFSHLVVPLLFFSHLMVSSSHCAVSTLHMTILLSHWVVSLLFSHLTISFSHCAVPISHVTVLSSHLVVSYFFFHTFDNFILILCSSNITCVSFFVTFEVGAKFLFIALTSD